MVYIHTSSFHIVLHFLCCTFSFKSWLIPVCTFALCNTDLLSYVEHTMWPRFKLLFCYSTTFLARWARSTLWLSEEVDSCWLCLCQVSSGWRAVCFRPSTCMHGISTACMLLASELHTYVCMYVCILVTIVWAGYHWTSLQYHARALPLLQSCQYIQTSSLDNPYFHSNTCLERKLTLGMRLQTLHHAGFTLLGLWWGGSGRLYCVWVWSWYNSYSRYSNNQGLLFPIPPHFEGR